MRILIACLLTLFCLATTASAKDEPQGLNLTPKQIDTVMEVMLEHFELKLAHRKDTLMWGFRNEGALVAS